MAVSSLPSSDVVGGASSASGTASGGADTTGSADSGIFPPFPEPVELRGTAANDVLLGTNADENMLGFRGDDLLFGGAGNDSLNGGIGNDRMEGGPGFDSYDGGPGTDTLTFSVADGPASADLTTNSVISGIVFEFVQNVENLTGSVFGDTLLGDDNDNVLVGGGGLDLLDGGLGDDILDGGRDGAYASWAESDGAVSVDLEAGRATEWDGGEDGLIRIIGAVGTDFDDVLRGGDAANLEGGDAANRLEGGAGADSLAGRGGDDVLVGGDGADHLQGGAGTDTADYSGTGPVRVSLQSGQALDSSGATDSLSGIEDLIGTLGSDVLTGDGGVNRLAGGVGADILRGGGGGDTFVFTDRLDFGDTIRDFQSGLDKIEVDGAVVGDGAITFDAADNHLVWDADGAADPVIVATIQGDGIAPADLVLV